MTVIRVTGDINSQMFNFTHGSGDVWIIDAPMAYPDGSYVCEVWAEDDAGNIGYATAILWIYDGKCTKIEWMNNPYNIKWINDGFAMKVIDSGMVVRLISSELTVKYIQSGYICRYMKCSEA